MLQSDGGSVMRFRIPLASKVHLMLSNYLAAGNVQNSHRLAVIAFASASRGTSTELCAKMCVHVAVFEQTSVGAMFLIDTLFSIPLTVSQK